MVVPFFVSLSSFSRDDDDDTTQQAERELFVVFVLVVFVFFSLVSFVCEEKRRDKVPFFLPFFFLSLSLSL